MISLGLSNDLNCRIDVYEKTKVLNEIGENEYAEGLIASIWANIIPMNGSMKNGQADTESVEISHKFVIRKNVIELKNTMIFVFENQRYEVKHYIPNYKKKDRIEVFCRLVVE